MIKDARETYVWQNRSQAECSLRQCRKGMEVLGVEVGKEVVGTQFNGEEKGEIVWVRKVEEMVVEGEEA